MTELRYAPTAVAGDVLRALAGAAVCAGVLLGASPVPWLAVLLALACLLFVSFGARAVWRVRQRFALRDEGLQLEHRGCLLAWSSLRRFRLKYFSTRRDHRDGWLELRLGFADGDVQVDSRLIGFDGLLDMALNRAVAAGLELDPATRRNLEWLGRTDVLRLADERSARMLGDA